MKKIYSIILLAALMITPFANGIAVVISDSDKPIQIVSDRFDIYPDKRVAVFSGNVVVTQEDTVINSDEFFLHYKKEGIKTKQNDKNVNTGIATGDIEKIEAKGNVIIKQKEKVVTGDNAFFYNGEQKIVVTGNPIMKEGNNIIKGDRVIFFLKENRGVVESSSTKRVTATIYPEEKK